jgi:site-specific DNA-methyltransferase (adenine-specific)
MDCLSAMQQMPDKYFDLAVVDPPYFSGPERRNFYGCQVSPIGVQRMYKQSEVWQVPDERYFDELRRVSKQQIIWGVNYFNYSFSPGRVVWDKCNGASSFSDCEIAYCSLHDSVRLYRYMWNGMCQGKSITEGYIMQGDKSKNEKRIHPTQKPVALYAWLYQQYAKPEDKILDTHLGSGSSRIAAWKLGLDFVGFEIDKYYFDLQEQRFAEEQRQLSFDFE